MSLSGLTDATDADRPKVARSPPSSTASVPLTPISCSPGPSTRCGG
ncbi:hypothetical protein HBB16_05460 [Pseudonocardia sp. MCCB 268]|nr:hypothetical protein [Pseudonocardia cytotoxica]